jgi:hypothetical protein
VACLENNLKKITLSRGSEKSDRLKTGTRLCRKAEAPVSGLAF